MGEYQTDAGSMDALRTHLKAIRTESARRDPKSRDMGGLAARERLRRRLEPLPERLAALDSRVTAKLEELGGTPRPLKESQPAIDESCLALSDIAEACFEIGDDSTNRDDAEFWYSFGGSVAQQFAVCSGQA
jgi:hypothetical protein